MIQVNAWVPGVCLGFPKDVRGTGSTHLTLLVWEREQSQQAKRHDKPQMGQDGTLCLATVLLFYYFICVKIDNLGRLA